MEKNITFIDEKIQVRQAQTLPYINHKDNEILTKIPTSFHPDPGKLCLQFM